MPCLSRLCLKLKGKQGSGPEGVDDLYFHTYGQFSPSSPPSVHPFAPPPVLRPKSQPQCQNLSQEAQILALRPKTQEEKEKIPHMCESIGH